jgi:hypothetical protein
MKKYRCVSPSIERHRNSHIIKFETAKNITHMQYFDINEARRQHQIANPRVLERPKALNTTNLNNHTVKKNCSDLTDLLLNDSPFLKPEKFKLNCPKVRI